MGRRFRFGRRISIRSSSRSLLAATLHQPWGFIREMPWRENLYTSSLWRWTSALESAIWPPRERRRVPWSYWRFTVTAFCVICWRIATRRSKTRTVLIPASRTSLHATPHWRQRTWGTSLHSAPEWRKGKSRSLLAATLHLPWGVLS